MLHVVATQPDEAESPLLQGVVHPSVAEAAGPLRCHTHFHVVATQIDAAVPSRHTLLHVVTTQIEEAAPSPP